MLRGKAETSIDPKAYPPNNLSWVAKETGTILAVKKVQRRDEERKLKASEKASKKLKAAKRNNADNSSNNPKIILDSLRSTGILKSEGRFTKQFGDYNTSILDSISKRAQSKADFESKKATKESETLSREGDWEKQLKLRLEELEDKWRLMKEREFATTTESGINHHEEKIAKIRAEKDAKTETSKRILQSKARDRTALKSQFREALLQKGKDEMVRERRTAAIDEREREWDERKGEEIRARLDLDSVHGSTHPSSEGDPPPVSPIDFFPRKKGGSNQFPVFNKKKPSLNIDASKNYEHLFVPKNNSNNNKEEDLEAKRQRCIDERQTAGIKSEKLNQKARSWVVTPRKLKNEPKPLSSAAEVSTPPKLMKSSDFDEGWGGDEPGVVVVEDVEFDSDGDDDFPVDGDGSTSPPPKTSSSWTSPPKQKAVTPKAAGKHRIRSTNVFSPGVAGLLSPEPTAYQPEPLTPMSALERDDFFPLADAKRRGSNPQSVLGSNNLKRAFSFSYPPSPIPDDKTYSMMSPLQRTYTALKMTRGEDPGISRMKELIDTATG
jgi:hypothetical protein